MKRIFKSFESAVVIALILSSPFTLSGQEEGDFVPLFNGKDLSGWRPINVASDTFSVSNGVIVSTGFPTGLFRTDRQYENFIIELEWRHMKSGGNAGLFVWSDGLPARGAPFPRGMEIQMLDNGFNVKGKNQWYTTHGDVFPVKGAVMTPADRVSDTGARSFPTEERSKSSPEWNHYRLEAIDGNLKLSVNGKHVTTGLNASPRKGYLCLESEGSECQFRNIRIKELPSTNPPPEAIADPAEGFIPLYNGVNLSGWEVKSGEKDNWSSRDWRLNYNGKGGNRNNHLWTEKSYRDFVLICDWRWTDKPRMQQRMHLFPNGDTAVGADGSTIYEEVPVAGDSGIYLRGSTKSQINIWCWPVGSGEIYGYRTDMKAAPEIREAATPKTKADAPIGEWNRFVITMKGERVSVNLNGKEAISEALLPGVPRSGPIALQDRGYPIEFANIYIKEL
jgi:hypothetical protein